MPDYNTIMNRRIFMNNKLFVGVDVSEATLEVAFLRDNATPVRPNQSYPNTPEGHRDITGAAVAAASLLGRKTKIVVGMESTSNFHKNLELVLRNHKPHQIEVHVINPKSIKNFRRMNLKVIKTDKLDAHMIALYIAKIQPEPNARDIEGQEELKELTRLRRSYIEEATRFKNRLRRLLRRYFPGYKQYLGKKISMKMLVAFSNFSEPDEILRKDIMTIANTKTAYRHKIGKNFAVALRHLAQQAPNRKMNKGVAMAIKLTARRILDIMTQIKQIESFIEQTLCAYFPDHTLYSVPGLGSISIASIIAEVGDIKRFNSVEKFIGYTGLYPVVWESGETKVRFKMTNKGNKMLKMTFLIASAASRRFNPVIRCFYDRLRANGKSKKAAGGAVARKLAVLVFTLLYKNEEWNPEIARNSLEKSLKMAG